MKTKFLGADYSLDNTLRYLYDSLRYKGAELMAIKFTYLDREYIADTPEEASRLRQLLEDGDYERAQHDHAFRGRMNQQLASWNEEKFWSVINGIGPQQTRLLVAVYLETSILAEELAGALQLSSQEALAGVVSGLSKQLEKLSIKPSEVFLVETYWVGKRKERHFQLSPGFNGAAWDFNWGHYWRMAKWAKEFESNVKKMKKKGKKRKK